MRFFIEVHHILFDGISTALFFDDLVNHLTGDGTKTGKTDFYYYVLSEREAETRSALSREERAYFLERYGRGKWTFQLPPDYETRDNASADMELRLPVPESRLREAAVRAGLGKDGVFVLAALLALSRITGADNVMLQWVHSGRNTPEAAQSVGMLYQSMPAALALTERTTLDEACSQVREQMQHAIQNRAYPFISLYPNAVTDDMVGVHYQAGCEASRGKGLLRIDDEETRQNAAASQAALDVEIWDEEDGKRVFLDYAGSRYRPETIERYGKLFVAAAQGIVEAYTTAPAAASSSSWKIAICFDV